MKIYFAAMESNSEDINYPKLYYECNRNKKKINILMSYYYIKSDPEKYFNKFIDYVDNFMLDSGAFTLFSSDKKSEIPHHYELFKNYIDENSPFLSSKDIKTFTLDSDPTIYGYENNYRIYCELRKIYPKIIPVIHQFADDSNDDEIDGYSSKNPDIIAIGQILDKKGEKKIRGLSANRQKLISSVNKIKQNHMCHLLGITTANILFDVPNIDSCDSRSWLLNSTTGKVFFNTVDKNGKFKDYIIHFPEFDKSTNKSTNSAVKTINFDLWEKDSDKRDDIKKFEMDINKLGLEIKDFRGYNNAIARVVTNIYYYEKMIEFINKSNLKRITPKSEQSD